MLSGQRFTINDDSRFKLQEVINQRQSIKIQNLLQQDLKKKIEDKAVKIRKANNLKRMVEVGIVNYYTLNQIKSNFHSNFHDLNKDYIDESKRRAKVKNIANKYLTNISNKLLERVTI